MRKFLLDKGPYVRSVDEKKISTERMMVDVIIALVPIIIFGFIFFGLVPFIKGSINVYWMLKPLINVVLGVASSVTFEVLYFLLFKKAGSLLNALMMAKESFAAIPGLILALIMPVRIDLYVIVYGCFFANIIFKMLFGGLGHNIFNPALIGYAICVLTFSGSFDTAVTAQNELVNGLLNITTSATPLANLASNASVTGSFFVSYDNIVAIYGNLFKLFLGFKNGCMGEVSGLLCIVGFVYLLVRKVINWRVPVFYVGTVFILCWIVAIVNHIDGPLFGIWFPTFNILTGGVLFCAVFMATEPVTTPKSPNGKIIFAVGCGIFTVLFRLIGIYPEGVCTAILFMCLFTPLIDKFAAKNRGSLITSKMIVSYIVLSLVFGLIAFYTVYKTTSIPKDEMPIVEVDHVFMIGDDFNG